MTKGELMQKNYTADELKQIDPSLPMDVSEDLRSKGEDTYFYVMNYNDNIFGTLEKMEEK